MYSVLIVDDEPLVQVGLQSMIDWSGLGIRLLPCASNGQAALEVILAEHPDVVITDIKMPLMDGLELIRKSREIPEPRPVFIVLTSHEDFGYAREAVKYRVSDYLVKLELTPEVLTRSVGEALKALPGPRKAAAVRQEAPGARWETLLGQTWSSEQAAGEALGEPGWDQRVAAAALCRFDGPPSDAWQPAVRMLAEILGREYEVRIIPRENQASVLILGTDGLDSIAAAARLSDSLTAALGMVQKYFNEAMTVGLGTPGSGLLALGASLRQAVQALEQANRPGRLNVFQHQENLVQPLTAETFRTGLEQSLTARDAECLDGWFGQARASIEIHGRLTDALDFGTAALYGVLAAASHGETLLAAIFQNRPEGAKSLYAVPSTAHVIGWLTELEDGLKLHLESSGARHQEKLVEAMKRYIESHYRERLQLKALADQFRLSPNYAGTLFHRFTGRSVSEYVSEVKVTKAREMLATKKYRIYEISEFLGFENTYYFSKVFRRVLGKSPREFASNEDND